MKGYSNRRNHSPFGIVVSKEMGEAMKQSNIPIGQVLAGLYCRCTDTVRHAFGRVEAGQDVFVQRTGHRWALEEAGEKLPTSELPQKIVFSKATYASVEGYRHCPFEEAARDQ